MEYLAASPFMTRDWCRAREAEGWDLVGIPDHLTGRGMPWTHLFVTAAEMALSTQRIGVQSLFANNLFRSPVEFAHASRTLQAVSGGRFLAGLGAGWRRDELEQMGLELLAPSDRARRFRDAAHIVRDLLHTGSCHFESDHYRVHIDGLGPPLDVPPPLIGAVGGPWTARHVSPLLDRVEINGSGFAIRHGEMDGAVLAATSQEQIRRLSDIARGANPAAPQSFAFFVAVGERAQVEGFVQGFKGGIQERCAGTAEQVAERIGELGELGFDRYSILELVEGSLEQLAPHLLT